MDNSFKAYMAFWPGVQYLTITIFLIALAVVHRNFELAALVASHIVLVATALGLQLQQERKRLDYTLAIMQHRQRLREGATIHLGHDIIRYNSLLTTYWMSIGAIMSSINIPSTYMNAKTKEHINSCTWWYSIVTLIVGWLSFPLGPVYAVIIPIRNLRGGDHIRVAQLIDGALSARTLRRSRLLSIATYTSAYEDANEKKPNNQEQELRSSLVSTEPMGPGSKSNKLLDKRTALQDMPSWEQRAYQYKNPPDKRRQRREKLLRKKDLYLKKFRQLMSGLPQPSVPSFMKPHLKSNSDDRIKNVPDTNKRP